MGYEDEKSPLLRKDLWGNGDHSGGSVEDPGGDLGYAFFHGHHQGLRFAHNPTSVKKYHHCPMLGVKSSNRRGRPYTCAAQHDVAPHPLSFPAPDPASSPLHPVPLPSSLARSRSCKRHMSSGEVEARRASEAAMSPRRDVAEAATRKTAVENHSMDVPLLPKPPSALLSVDPRAPRGCPFGEPDDTFDDEDKVPRLADSGPKQKIMQMGTWKEE